MRRHNLAYIGSAAFIAAGFLGLLVLSQVGGCAAGRGPDGSVILGWNAATLTETTSEALTSLGNGILPGLGVLLTAIGVPAIGWARAKARADATVAASDAHDDAWEESELRTRSTMAQLGVARPVVPASPANPAEAA